MEKYTKAQMEVIEFEAEDVITTRGGCKGMDVGVGGWGCGTDNPSCSKNCWEFNVS